MVTSIDLIFEQYHEFKYLLVVVERDTVLVYMEESTKKLSNFYIAHNRISFEEAVKFILSNEKGSSLSTESGTGTTTMTISPARPSSITGLVTFANANLHFVLLERAERNTRKKLEVGYSNFVLCKLNLDASSCMPGAKSPPSIYF